MPRRSRLAGKHAAELDARQAMGQAKAQGRVDIAAAADEAFQAAAERRTAEHIAENAHDEADRIRARAARLANEAELP